MSSIASALPTPALVRADVLKLRRRRGLGVVVGLLTVGAVVVTVAVMELLHVVDPTKHGPAGGVTNVGHIAFLVAALGAVAATLVGATAGAGDLDAGVYRELVVTGRSRLALFASRLPAGLAYVLPFTALAYALGAAASVVFAGDLAAPSVHVLTVTGLWALLEAAFYFPFALGLACLLGSRSYTIGSVLAWRLAITPLLASISALGVVRELVPGVALDRLMPAAIADASGGTRVGMSIGAIVVVLTAWTLILLAAGALRDTTRDA